MKYVRPLALLTTVVLVAAACGGDDDDAASGDGARTVHVDMVDIAFEPDELDVQAGETVRFLFENHGDAVHDAFIGDAAAQAEHEEEMTSKENDEHGSMGREDEGITVDPDDTGEITYTFDEPGTLEIGCHQPGHYDAGMKVTITVS